LFVPQILIIWSSKLHVQVYRFAPKPSTVCILHTVVMFKAIAVLSGFQVTTVTHIALLIEWSVPGPNYPHGALFILALNYHCQFRRDVHFDRLRRRVCAVESRSPVTKVAARSRDLRVAYRPLGSWRQAGSWVRAERGQIKQRGRTTRSLSASWRGVTGVLRPFFRTGVGRRVAMQQRLCRYLRLPQGQASTMPVLLVVVRMGSVAPFLCQDLLAPRLCRDGHLLM